MVPGRCFGDDEYDDDDDVVVVPADYLLVSLSLSLTSLPSHSVCLDACAVGLYVYVCVFVNSRCCRLFGRLG